jgi:valyl-tRNA synthetase
MFGLHFTGQVPFRRVLLSGLVVDETGDKMSKVKGNVIDPLDLVRGATFTDMVEKALPGAAQGEALAKFKKAYPSAAAMGSGFPPFGADAVRFTLATYPPSNKRIARAPKRIEGNRHFLNKIWNASRLSIGLLGDFAWPMESTLPKELYNRWIRSRFAAACETVHDGMEDFRIDEAALGAYRFFWNDLCDWYLELVKAELRDAGKIPGPAAVETRETLAYVLEGSLRLMHPLMPFVTEELWQRVKRPPSRSASIAFGPYPTKVGERPARDLDAEAWMDLLKAVISAARTIRSEHDIDNKAEVTLLVRSESGAVLDFLSQHGEAIRLLVKTRGNPSLQPLGAPREPGTTLSVVPSPHGPIEVLVVLKGLVEPGSEASRIDRELKKIERDLAALDKKLGSPGFADRAPKELVEEAHQQRRSLIEAKARLEAARKLVDEL